jgi:hypothetical protein
MAQEETEVVRVRRRINPVFLVAGGVAILALLWFFVISPLFSSDEETTQTPPAANAPVPSASPTAAAAASAAAAAEPPPETFEVFESKDPFRPLIVEQTAAAGGTANAATGAGGGTSSNANGGGTATGSTGAGGAPAPSGGQRVTLLDVLDEGGTTKAQVKVGSTVYKVASGEVFADNFKVVSISGNCVTLLHGDDKFTLCEGEEVIK